MYAAVQCHIKYVIPLNLISIFYCSDLINICETNNEIMQRPPYGNAPFQGGPMQPGVPGGPGYVNPGGPQYAPGYGQPPYGAPIRPQQAPGNPGCFMPAATIRKISNTTPPQFLNNNNRL